MASAPAPASLQDGCSVSKGVKGSSHTPKVPRRKYSLSKPPSLLSLQSLVSQTTKQETYPHAAVIKKNIPIYDLSSHSSDDPKLMSTLQDEWHHILLSGPGVLVLQNFLTSTTLLETVNRVFSDIIALESATSTSKGDHFAASGNNARIWNSFQKHGERDPVSFVQYYSNHWIAAVCEAWLGPAYQVTAQVNLVRPGGKPQVSHRDYHLGFQPAEVCAMYPKATQIASQFLTLQGAVAHSDMPLSSGPTRFLPFSQQFEEGFMAYRLKEFQDYFDKSWVSCDLRIGDAVFFNPALFHAAGENMTTDVQRSATLLQISSSFGRTMESVDTLAIIEKCWDEVTQLYKELGMNGEVAAVLNAIGEGYPFPTNLDRRPPVTGGMAPESEIDILRRCLLQGWDREKVIAAITILREETRP